jgi:hypothetical protein
MLQTKVKDRKASKSVIFAWFCVLIILVVVFFSLPTLVDAIDCNGRGFFH